MTRTSRKVRVRTLVRERTALARKAQREREDSEDRLGEEYEVARRRRDRLVAEVAAAERDMGLRIEELLALGNKIPAVAVMTGEESHDEVRRLKRLADLAQRRPARSATAPSADAAATDDDQAPSPAGHRSPDGMPASNANPASQPPGDVARQHE